MPPDDHIQIPPESSAQISSNHPSVWQRYWYWIIGAIAIILVVVIVIFWNPFSNTKTGSQFRINPNLSDTPYASLYLCGQEIFSTVGIFATDKLDARSLTGDSLFILDGTNNLLYFYTSSYADKTQFETDKNGQTVKLATDTGSLGQWFQYNLRIPHLSSGAPGSGYFYMTINDLPYGGHHDGRSNYPPRFISGEPETQPDFSKVKSTSHITITSYPTTTGDFHPLQIEDQIWSSQNLDTESVNKLSSAIISRIGDLHRTTSRCAGNGCPSLAQREKTYQEVLTTCENAGHKMNNQELLNAISLSRQNAESNPNDSIPTSVENIIKKAGQPFITLPKESAHADYSSESVSSDVSAGLDAGQPASTYTQVADRAHFKDLKFVSYATDGIYGYYWAFGMTANGPPVHWEKIPNSDGATFHILGGPYAADKNNVYFETPYKVSVVSHQPKSFSIVDMKSGISKDSNTAYFACTPISNADAQTLSIIETNSSYYGAVKDKNYLYIIIQGSIDTDTLYRLPVSEAAALASGTE